MSRAVLIFLSTMSNLPVVDAGHALAIRDEVRGDVTALGYAPSTTTRLLSADSASSREMTPFRPTFSMAAEIISPISMLPPAKWTYWRVLRRQPPWRCPWCRRGSGGLSLLQRELHRVGTSHDNLHTFRNHRRGEHSSGGGTVTGFVVRLLGRLSDELGAGVFNRISRSTSLRR